jgi:hypothetical protein
MWLFALEIGRAGGQSVVWVKHPFAPRVPVRLARITIKEPKRKNEADDEVLLDGTHLVSRRVTVAVRVAS